MGRLERERDRSCRGEAGEARMSSPRPADAGGGRAQGRRARDRGEHRATPSCAAADQRGARRADEGCARPRWPPADQLRPRSHRERSAPAPLDLEAAASTRDRDARRAQSAPAMLHLKASMPATSPMMRGGEHPGSCPRRRRRAMPSARGGAPRSWARAGAADPTAGPGVDAPNGSGPAPAIAEAAPRRGPLPRH